MLVLIISWISLVVLISSLVATTSSQFCGADGPKWGYALVGGWLRWQTRVNAFLLGLTDEYPPFRLSD